MTAGLSGLLNNEARSGDGLTTLQTPTSSLTGNLALRFGHAEFGPVMRVSQGRMTGDSSLTRADGPRQYGLRMRASPGGEVFSLGLSAEAGIRRWTAVSGTSVICDAEAGPQGFERTNIDGCWASERAAGELNEQTTAYFTGTVYPTLRLAKGVYVYAGIGLDQIATTQQRRTIWATYDVGFDHPVSHEVDTAWCSVPLAVAGLDVTLDDHFGLLLTVRTSLNDELPLPGPVAEAGFTARF